MKSNKILYVIIIGLVVAIIVLGAFFVSDLDREENNNNTNNSGFPDWNDVEPDTTVIDAHAESADILEEERKAVTYIDVEEYFRLLASDENSIIYIGRPTCGFCNVARPIIEHIAFLNNLTVHYLNTDEMSNNEMIDLTASDEFFANGIGTPLLLIVRNGRIVDTFPGLSTINGYTEFFKGHDLIS